MKGEYASASKNPREREERRAGASGLEDTFGGKINVGEEYEGQNKYRFPERL